MANLFEELEKLLGKNQGLFNEQNNPVIDGKLAKNKVIELSLKLDPILLKVLLSNETIKRHFFEDVDGVLVFDKLKFQKFVSNKSFLADSFTAFKNKIGLTVDGEFLSESKEVVLSWPYKDCVLEGGLENEDEKSHEIFFNEILAPDEIDRLYEPKVLTNFKKIDKNGEQKITGFSVLDNLIIKGNNLLSLHSLEKKYAGAIKMIYIDPPYNIGGDFLYNDSFNHSSWLTFMKNRLEIAWRLLSPDGAIFVQIDHHEIAYLNVLMDEIFKEENKVQIIAIKVSAASGFKAVNPGPIDVTEFILFYTKDKNKFKFKTNYVEAEYHENYNLFLQRADRVEDWKLLPLKEVVIKSLNFINESEIKKKYGDAYKVVLQQFIADFAFKHAEEVVSIRDLHKPSKVVKDIQEKSRIERDKIFTYKKTDGTFSYIINGGVLAFYSSKIKEVNGENSVVELLTNFWNHISWAGIAREGGVRLKNGKKPEKLIKQLTELVDIEEGDIILDFFLGSGTTCAVAHKMNRRYIGIEQLDYKENDSVARLKNVINGDASGISKAVTWKGGGSFIYCELKKWNEIFTEKISAANSNDELLKIWEEMQQKAFLSYKITPDVIEKNAKDFSDLSLEDQKRFLMEVLDKNQLYVNLSEMDDETYGITEEEKALNRQFYGLE